MVITITITFMCACVNLGIVYLFFKFILYLIGKSLKIKISFLRWMWPRRDTFTKQSAVGNTEIQYKRHKHKQSLYSSEGFEKVFSTLQVSNPKQWKPMFENNIVKCITSAWMYSLIWDNTFHFWAPEQLSTNTAVETGLILTTNLEHVGLSSNTSRYITPTAVLNCNSMKLCVLYI